MKLTKMQKLYKYLQEYFTDYIYKINFKDIKLSDNRDTILNEIANILLKYNVDEELHMDMTAGEIVKENKRIGKIINDVLIGEYKKENSKLKNVLSKVIDTSYNANNYILSIGVNCGLKKVTDVQRDKIINYTIQGKNFSNRLYDDKNNVAKKLKLELNNLLKGDTSINEIRDKISYWFDVDKHISKRLISNEISRCQAQINDVWQQEHSEYIGKVMWSATLESNTCSECADLDGQTWRVDEEHPVPIDSTHPLCRCCLISLPIGDWKPSTRLDNETKENINWTTFNEWLENKGVDRD